LTGSGLLGHFRRHAPVSSFSGTPFPAYPLPGWAVLFILLRFFCLFFDGFWNHQGVTVCLGGLGLLVYADIETDRNSGGGGDAATSRTALGDALCVIGALCYSISNVAEEAIVKRHDTVRFLAMLGLFGTMINGVQL